MKRHAGDVPILTIDVPAPMAAELKKRFAPIVRRSLEVAAIRQSADLTEMLLSVYLQGVMDGSNPAVQALLAKEPKP